MTIYSSLAIENNSLTLDQMTAILEGKRVLGPPNEIKEVRNAIDAYNLLLELDPFKVKDLLRAHRLMTDELIKETGQFRNGDVGVFGKQGLVHLAPPSHRVPTLITQLFDWVKNTDVHPIISSCVFHYEFEFIHPFADGNGRMGRMWQTLLLMQWNPVFAWVPVETIVKEHQQAYYRAIAVSDKRGESSEFIGFMLRCLRDALDEMRQAFSDERNQASTSESTLENTLESTLKGTPKLICELMAEQPKITITEVADRLGLNRRGVAKHVQNLQQQGIIRRVGPNKGGHWEIITK